MEILTFNVDLDKRNLVEDKQNFNVDFHDSKYAWIQARQYEDSMRQVEVHVVHGDNSPFDLTGVNPNFFGWLPEGNYRIIDAKHAVMLDPVNGIFRFDFPAAAFAISGSYKQAFFRLMKDGMNVSTLEFSLDVLADKVISGLIPSDYITPFNDLYGELSDIVKNANGDLTSALTDWTTKLSTLFSDLSKQGIDTQTMLTTLEQQIKQDGLMTQADLDKALNSFQTKFAKLQNKIEASAASATTFATMHRLGQKYRNQGTVGSNAQGFAGLGGTTVVQYYQNFEPMDRQYGTLVKFNVETGTEILSNEIKGYHGNSMTYNAKDGMLYMAMAEDSTDVDTVQKKKVLQIDPATLTIKNTIDLTAKTALPIIHSIGYDSADDCFIVADNKTMEFYDSSWTLQFTIQWADLIGYEPGFMQGVQVHGSNLYWIGGRKSQIWAYTIDYDNKSLTYRTTYSFDDFQEGLYPTGELEGLAFNDNGSIYVCSHITVGKWGGLTQYFVTNDNFKVPIAGSTLVAIQSVSPSPTEFFVGNNTAYNPDGTKSNPFASLLEATTCMRTPYTPFKKLTMLTDMDDTLALIDIDNAMLNTQSHKVKATVIINCSNLYIPSLQMTGYSRYKMNALYVYNSQMRINDLKSPDLTANPDVTEAVHIERSNVFVQDNSKARIKLYNSTFDSAGSTYNLEKDNFMSKVLNNQVLGTITNVSNSNELTAKDFAYYSTMNVQVTTQIAGDKVGFQLSAPINGGIVNLIGHSQSSDVIYLCAFHYVKNSPATTTLEFFSLPAFTKVTPKSYSITATVSDR
ncbi:phage baseplate upper protein [Lactiplantibacillus pentosus]|uniref:phage baseplate upper protein n=1 Tax=Lactiplantibacillus pentosus TaxID=1589 RepID=UPI003F53E02E